MHSWAFFLSPVDGSVVWSTVSRGQKGGPDDSVAPITGLNDGEWHHAVAVWDSGNKKIYIDGGLVFEEKINKVNAELGNDQKSYCYIGDGSAEENRRDGRRTNTFYEGHIASMHVWDTVFTDQEIKEIWLYQIRQEMGGLGRCEEFTAMDIVFVLDETASVNPTELEEAQQFAMAILGKFYVDGPDPDLYTQIGVLSYAFDAVPAFDLGTHGTNGAVELAIDALPTQYGVRLSGENLNKKTKKDKVSFSVCYR